MSNNIIYDALVAISNARDEIARAHVEHAPDNVIAAAESKLEACQKNARELERIRDGPEEYLHMLRWVDVPEDADVLVRVLAWSTFSDALRAIITAKNNKRRFPEILLRAMAEPAFACRFPQPAIHEWLKANTVWDDPWVLLVAKPASTTTMFLGDGESAPIPSIFSSKGNAAAEEAMLCHAYEAICVRCLSIPVSRLHKIRAPKRVRRKADDASD